MKLIINGRTPARMLSEEWHLLAQRKCFSPFNLLPKSPSHDLNLGCCPPLRVSRQHPTLSLLCVPRCRSVTSVSIITSLIVPWIYCDCIGLAKIWNTRKLRGKGCEKVCQMRRERRERITATARSHKMEYYSCTRQTRWYSLGVL